MGTRRVLVIDDDLSIREAMELALTEEGYDVRVAPDGATGLSLIEEWQPTVILLDLKMPGMDGWKFAEAYRRGPAPRAPVVVLTAADDAEGWAPQIGASAVLPKPFDLTELLDVVHRHTAEARG
jgi:CheY-like chemotaxis protein